jgi:putative PEP-CTERM system TPR-repeat lipoprotein
MTISNSLRAAAGRLALAGFAAVLLSACGQDTPEKLMVSAKEQLAKGDRNAAVIHLKNLLAKAPDTGEARLLLGEALLDAEDYVSAEKELGRALELKQPQEKALPPYVRALLGQGKYRAVVTEVEKYRLFDPAAVAATQTALGDAQLRLGNRARAGEAYAAALAAVPGHPRARLGEATLLAYEGKVDDALRQIDEVAAAEPKLAEAKVLLAEMLLAKGERDGAKKALQEAVAANDNYVPARLALIRLLSEDNEFDAAAKLIEGTSRIAPRDLRVPYLDASLAYRRGDTERARQQVQTVLKHLPDYVPALVLSGTIDLRAGQFPAAESSLRRALARAPTHFGARQLLVQTYLRMGQPDKAKQALQPLVERGLPANPQLLLLAGETYLASGDTQRATAFYQAAAKSQNEQLAARTRLGQIALASGRSEEGFTELEAASALDAGSYQADLALITGHLQRRELDKALEAVKSLQKKQPKNPLTFQMYGVVNLAKSDFDAARKDFDKALELQPTYLPAAYNLAQLDVLQKKPEEARRRYEAMTAKEPDNEHIYLALAQLQSRTGATAKEVVTTLQRAVAADPQSPAARVGLINYQLRIGDGKAALASAQDALAAIPSDPRVLEAAAVAQESAGEVNQAIGTYNKLASLQPQATQPLYQLSALYFRQKDTDRAIESLRRVQKIAPRDRDVVPQLVQIYVAAGRHAEALREVQDLQKREPKFAGGWSLEGDVYVAQKKLGQAEQRYRDALKLAPKANAVAIKLHSVLQAQGRTAEADALARKWIADNPKDAPMRLYLADRELGAKNLKASAAHYRAALEIQPESVVALNNLAWIAGELGDPKALEYAARAVRLAPNDAGVLDTYGMLLVRKGEVDKALPVLERARKIAPARNDLRVNYAKALVKAGRKDEARKELEALQEVKENFAGKDELAGLLKGL